MGVLVSARENPAMTVPRPTLRNIELRPVSIPLKRPVVSKVVLFERWPLARIDLSHRGGHRRAPLPRALSRALDALLRPRHSRSGRSAQGPTDSTTRRFRDESRRAAPARDRGRVDDRRIGG